MLPEIREMDPEETHRPTYPAKPRKRAAAGKGKRAAAVAARKPKKKKKGGKHA